MNLIFHTSHCGSTLMTALLSTVVNDTYSEPGMTHEFIKNKQYDLAFDYKLGQKTVVKLPSGLCHLAPQSKERGIFLYRNLKEHLIKVYSNDELSKIYLSYYM